jgi:hypothetical protein
MRRVGLRFGIFLVLIGFGSVVLHAKTDYQFTYLKWADGMQPYAGIVVGLIGLGLLFGPFILRALSGRRSSGAAPVYSPVQQDLGPQGYPPLFPQQGVEPNQWGQPAQQPFGQQQPFPQPQPFAQPSQFAQPQQFAQPSQLGQPQQFGQQQFAQPAQFQQPQPFARPSQFGQPPAGTNPGGPTN